MQILRLGFTVLIIGAAGGIVYTLATNAPAITAFFNGIDGLARTSYAAELGKVA